MLIGVLTSPATANTPSTAATAQPGVTHFGTTKHTCEGSYCNAEFWRLPALRAQDEVTIAWVAERGYFCLTGNVDDFDYAQNMCNLSEYQRANATGRREVVTVDQPTASAFATFDGSSGLFETGPYQFVLETIRSKIGVALPAVNFVKRGGRIAVKPTLTDGTPVPDGVEFTLVMRFRDPDKTVERTARVDDGKVRFGVKLAGRFAGRKARFTIVRSSDSLYQAVRSPQRTVVVK